MDDNRTAAEYAISGNLSITSPSFVSPTFKANSSEYLKHKEFYESAKKITGLYLFPIICILGIIGNVLTFIVFIKIKPRSSTTVFLTTLAISDTIKLVCDFLYFIVVCLEKTGHTTISHQTFVALYPYAHYTLNFSLCNTAWLTVAVAVERYIYMKWPERANTICTVTRSTITCCIIWLSSMLVAIPFVLRYKHYPKEDGTIDITVSPLWQITEFTDAYVWVQNILRSIIPLIVLVILNAWIIRALSRLSKRHMAPPPCKMRATSMLVAMIMAFLVCITPDAVLSAVFGFGYTDAPMMIKGIREISDVLLSLNSAINFFLYFTFNKIFRQKLSKLLCPKRDPCRTKPRRKQQWMLIKDGKEGVT
ncbi:FMRFamide receptor-like [Watersipora subatra]|uniref:FMRFamide receptor-like n=1 Tax=Watersipora subatra TaxID=2589382 RepID=UPI00355C0F96